ncbi:MAG: hypothetical protein JWN34_5528 [Bryobacterales bacterium]|nr:hypothetical protein [Bryobacterales bacterium]
MPACENRDCGKDARSSHWEAASWAGDKRALHAQMASRLQLRMQRIWDFNSKGVWCRSREP